MEIVSSFQKRNILLKIKKRKTNEKRKIPFQNDIFWNGMEK
jgi:hypothetical protein